MQGQNAIQLTATDSTQLYELYDKLQVKNHNLEIMNQKLREYGNQLEGLTKEQERLSLKMRIHDAIGQNLIATKYFLLGDLQTGGRKIRRDCRKMRKSGRNV